MAIIWADGFDSYTDYDDDPAHTAPTMRYGSTNQYSSVVDGRFGGKAFGYGTSSPRFSVPAVSTFAIGFAHYFSDSASFSRTPYNELLYCYQASGGNVVILGIDSAGALYLGKTSNATSQKIANTDAGVLETQAWHFIELEVSLDTSSAGTAKVYLDGVAVLTATDIDFTASTVDTFSFGTFSVNGSAACRLDDLYVTDSAVRLGELRIETVRVSADTTDKDFAPLSGTDNYAMVNGDTFDGDTSYVSSDTAGDMDIYAVGNISESSPQKIHAVQVSSFARKDGAASRTYRNKLVSGDTTSNGSTNSVSSSYQRKFDIIETDPDTDVAWTAAGVNALQIGVEVVS